MLASGDAYEMSPRADDALNTISIREREREISEPPRRRNQPPVFANRELQRPRDLSISPIDPNTNQGLSWGRIMRHRLLESQPRPDEADIKPRLTPTTSMCHVSPDVDLRD